MTEDVDVKKDIDYLGVDAKRLGQTKAPKSGKRKLVQEKDPLTEVRSGQFKDTRYQEQDFRSNASTSLWKEYFLDKKHITGVLLDNNMLVWFPWDKELTGREPASLARERYPDSKVIASFLFGEKGLGMSNWDLAIRSETETFDNRLNSLVDYFGRSLDWQEGVKVSTSCQDRSKQGFQGSMQEYLVSY